MLTLCKFTEALKLYERTIISNQKEYGVAMGGLSWRNNDNSEPYFEHGPITVLVNYRLLCHVLNPVRAYEWSYDTDRVDWWMQSLFTNWDVSNLSEITKILLAFGPPYHGIGELAEVLGDCRLHESYMRDDVRLQGHSFPHCDLSCKYPRSIVEARSSRV